MTTNKSGQSSARADAFAGNDGFDFYEPGQKTARPAYERIKNVLPFDGTMLTAGQSGAGKSTLVMDMIAACASGGVFFGKPVRERCGIVYVATEAGGGVARRFCAACEHRGIDPKDQPVLAINSCPDFCNWGAVRAFTQAIRKRSERLVQRLHGTALEIVVIDTLPLAFQWEKDPDGAQVKHACQVLAYVAEQIDGLAIGVVHFGKDITKGIAGPHAWKANVDTVWAVLADRNEATGESENRWLTMPKNREGIEGPIGPFELSFHAMGSDAYGDDWGACVIVPSEGDADDIPDGRERPAEKPERKEPDALACLLACFDALKHEQLVCKFDDGMHSVRETALKERFLDEWANYGEPEQKRSKHACSCAWRRACDEQMPKWKSHFTFWTDGNGALWLGEKQG